MRPVTSWTMSAGMSISIHAPHAGCDGHGPTEARSRSDFNPRTPCGVRPSSYSAISSPPYFNPRTPCGVRPAVRKEEGRLDAISIHAPHAGCDSLGGCKSRFRRYFNPRTPCGVRHIVFMRVNGESIFQSTHPMRGATVRWFQSRGIRLSHFNPRTPCGVRLNSWKTVKQLP